jgi:hypothetical protein
MDEGGRLEAGMGAGGATGTRGGGAMAIGCAVFFD